MLRVANPIYDVVFKYLLGDNKVAKKLLSLIIEKEVVTLELKPTEYRTSVDTKEKVPLAVLHIDFAATIRTEDGELKKLIIELQKAKLPTDIMRFRRYLGSQYSSDENVFEDEEKNKKPLPILTIYFLGHYLDHTRVPVIEVNRSYFDRVTREEIKEKEEFIESLTHDSIIIQIPALKSHRRNNLEKVLSVFDASGPHKHFVDVDESDYPEEYSEVIRRLVSAGANAEVRETMCIEDDIVEVLVNNERALAKAVADKEEALAEKEEAIAEREEANAKKQEALEKAERAIDVLAEKMGISREEAEKLIRGN